MNFLQILRNAAHNPQIIINKSLTGLLLLILFAAGCDSKKVPLPPKVVVSKPVTMAITPYLITTGNTVASSAVDLVARVSGYLDAYRFKDGSQVKKGELLFVIQPQPYADQVKATQATLDENIAAYTYDQIEYQRQLNMYKKHATSLAEVQQWLATRNEAAAAVDGAQANLDNAQITYSYTHIIAPIDGWIGRHLVDPGNLVGNGEATKLASVQQIDPMYVYFTLNELDVLKIRRLHHTTLSAELLKEDTGRQSQLPLEIALQNECGFPHPGYVDFAATELDAATGTLQMRGILSNKDEALLPGLFVQVRIALDKPTPQLTLPETALQQDQIGAYVFTVDQKNKVTQTRVDTGRVEQGRAVILKGLNATAWVIVQGMQNVTPGEIVTPIAAAIK